MMYKKTFQKGIKYCWTLESKEFQGIVLINLCWNVILKYKVVEILNHKLSKNPVSNLEQIL